MPLRRRKRIGALCVGDHLILRCVDEGDFGWIVGIEKLRANKHAEIFGVLGQFVDAGGVENLWTKVIVVDQEDRHVASIGNLRQRDRRAARRIDNGARIERVLVHPHDRLLVERRGFAEMVERVDRAAVQLNDVAEAAVGLRADVGLGGYGFEQRGASVASAFSMISRKIAGRRRGSNAARRVFIS